MGDSLYQVLDKLICEYEDDVRTIRSDKLIMINYPKIFTMSMASLFENELKQNIKDFLQFPSRPISSTYPKLSRLLLKTSRPPSDNIYAKLKGFEDENGIETLDAQDFYCLFGEQTFKRCVETNYNCEKNERISETATTLTNLSPLLAKGIQYEIDYAKYSDIHERLQQSTFNKAENAFLSIKLRRNRVAHNYIYGLSDSFEDIRNFYYDAVLYVVALKTTLVSLTSLPS